MKRCLAFALLFVIPLALTASPAFGLMVHARLYSNAVLGEEGAAGAAIQVILSDDHGNTRAWVNETADGAGYWRIELPPGAVIMPDDRLTVWENLSSYQLEKIPRIAISGIAVGTDVVRGRILPRRSEVEIRVSGTRLTESGWSGTEFSATAPTAEDGTFTADLTAAGDLKRFDAVNVGYQQGVFLVYNLMFAPGFDIYLNTGMTYMAGRRGSSYDLELVAPSGRVKDTTTTTMLEMFYGMSFVEFSRAGGRPVPIRSGDRVRAIGAWGFTDRVEPLSLSVDIAADTFQVKARRDALVELSVEGLRVYRRVDAEGNLVFDWASVGWDVQPQDDCGVTYQDPQGNLVRLRKQALAP